MRIKARALAWLPLLGIIAIGAAVRLYRIGELPNGFYRDEGWYALDALNVLRGRFALFFAANNGREGLFIYWLAASIGAFGRSVMGARLASALVGIATLPAIYAAGSALFSRRVGLLAAAILATTFWHVAISRVVFRAISLPLLLCLFAAAASWAWTTRRPLALFAAGLSFGLTFYTYTSGQFIAVWALAVLAIMAWRSRGGNGRGFWAGAGWMLLGAGLALCPLAFWLTRHSDLYLARAGQVSVLNAAINQGDLIGTLIGNAAKAAAMWVWRGDRIWRMNLPYRPVFNGGVALAFVIGLAVCVINPLRRAAGRGGGRCAVLVLWLLVFLIPTVLAEDTPHFLRAIGALPAGCLIAALGMEACLRWMSRRGFMTLPGLIARRISPPALAALVVIGYSAQSTLSDYFTLYVNDPLTAYWLEANNAALAREVEAVPAADVEHTWLEDRLTRDNSALRFLSPRVEAGLTSTGPLADLTPDRGYTEYVFDPNQEWGRVRAVLPSPSEIKIAPGAKAQGDLEASPHIAYVRLTAHPVTSTTLPAAAQFEQEITLRTAEVISAGGTSYVVRLRWSSEKAIDRDYAVFVQWFRPGSGPAPAAQADSSPAGGYLPMPWWRPGDVILDDHPIAVAGGWQPGDRIEVGVYSRENNVRLRRVDTNTENRGPGGDSVIISTPR